MTTVGTEPRLLCGPKWTARGLLWFAWMEAMWGAFFALLLAGDLDRVWDWVTALPVLGQVAAWLVAFPWLLSTAVWGASWAGGLRLAVVLVFALGWSAASVPRQKYGALRV